MKYIDKRPFVLSIAGFDPSAGAGLLADIKTIEAIKGYGLGVCTANTIQHDEKFDECQWMAPQTIKQQLNLLLEKYTIATVKIGVIENTGVLEQLLDILIAYNSSIKIVLDPVLKATSGYSFQEGETFLSEGVLRKITLITPNYDEIQQLYPGLSMDEAVSMLHRHTDVLLKGGHHPQEKGKDILYEKGKEKYTLLPCEEKVYEKHGSGCILSTAVASYLAFGLSLKEACAKAKQYTETTLKSNPSKLAYHLWK